MAFRGIARCACALPRVAVLHPVYDMLFLKSTSVAARSFCASVSSDKLTLPKHIVDVSHSRSSGAGGQNVNKVSTKVTLRLAMSDAADFLPNDVMERLREQQRTRITKADELVLQADEERTQGANLRRAFQRLQSFVDAAAVLPKERLVSLEPPARVKEQRRREKRLHSAKKRTRRGGDD
eukprot:CAMPEP_0115876026 /NCGR_PEP_ID=MMETSP0287-20121206/25428_1 /TAXON_ID=412157 /ORGANISM="Chrysochromulina rotalis, Strain UIO044" /LENGTH=179 /DNA_ID=CAMNT_0003331363 /DNA_START=13 /DNA_END=552 /DNA_ORIENTATION=-